METTYKIFLRTDNKNIDGSNTLYLLFTSKRKLKKISLNIKVKSKDWDIKKLQVKKSDRNYLRKNKYIRKYDDKARKIIDTYFFDEKILTISEFERSFKNKFFNNKSFYDFIESEIKTLEIEDGTRKNYIKQISKLKSFKKELYFNEIDVKFLNDYNYFLRTERNNNDNTRKAALSFLKQVINKARKQEITEVNPFINYKVGVIKGQKESLTKAELDKLENLLKTDLLVNNEKSVLEYFLFDCYTGLRISDLENLKFSNIKTGVIDNKEYKFLKFISKKTKKLTEVPIISKIEKFIKPCEIPNQKVFKVFTGQGTNRVLKRIMKKAHINKHITSHCARYTFISVASELKISTENIQAIVKHSKLEETLGYLNVQRNVLVKEMQKFDV